MLTRPTYRPEITIVATRRFLMTEIQASVSRTYKVKISDIESSSRARINARPRHVAMWMSRNLLKRTYPEIAAKFKRRNHTTAMNAVREIDERILVDNATWAIVRDLLIELNGSAPSFQLELRL